MKDLPAVRWLLLVLLDPGWAPLTVVGLHLVLAEFGLTHKFDRLLHFLGGAAAAFFVYRLTATRLSLPNTVPRWMHYLLGFTVPCTIAVFWEFAEFGSDRLLGTTIQQSLTETVLDLLFGVAGAGITLLTIAAFHLMIRSKLNR